MPAPPHRDPSRLPPAFPARAAWGTAKQLRAWQTAALQAYTAADARDFLVVATPGAGKTSFALTLAADLLDRRQIQRVVVVAPTEHLKTQWAEAAARIGLAIDPGFGTGQGRTSRDFVGVALTYAGVAANPLALRIRTEAFKTLVVLDEIHHAGDALSWGEAVREAFEPAARRLLLTGTPFRSDAHPIPFVRYEPDPAGGRRSRADYTYGYADALADGIVRPVLFLAYSGDVHWRTSAGDEVAARLGGPMTRDLAGQALRTALDPQGSWIPAVLRAAETRLAEIRGHVPDAAGLVIATDQASARAYAALLRSITGTAPVLVLSDEPRSSASIARFAEGSERWMVAVRMVSEGVDVPRLAVGVYATSAATPLYFAQAVGRFVRARSRGETASIFVPSVPNLLRYAAEMEAERDHVLRAAGVPDEADLLVAAERVETEADLPTGEFAALASEADFDRVVFDGGEFGLTAQSGSDAERDYLGLPGLLEPEQVKHLLRRHQRDQEARSRADADAGGGAADERRSTHAELRDLRRELNGLVAAWHHRTDSPHGVIHATLRTACGGPPSATATAEELQARIDLLRSWAIRGRS